MKSTLFGTHDTGFISFVGSNADNMLKMFGHNMGSFIPGFCDPKYNQYRVSAREFSTMKENAIKKYRVHIRYN